MSNDSMIEKRYPISCRGFNSNGKSAFKEAIEVSVWITQDKGDQSRIYSRIDRCPRYHDGICNSGLPCEYLFEVPKKK
jgi:hypothetical protein